jgi:hypothetical protein
MAGYLRELKKLLIEAGCYYVGPARVIMTSGIAPSAREISLLIMAQSHAIRPMKR